MRGVNKPCAMPGCPNIALKGNSRCALHITPTLDDRPSPSARGYDRAWQATRKRFLHRNPLCESCGSIATEVHHIVMLANGGTHDETNLMPLCKRCHSRITAKG